MHRLFKQTDVELKCEIKLVASKTVDNFLLKDNERRASGSNVDGKLTSSSGPEIAVVEISGPPLVTRYGHFASDRVKLACNMKKNVENQLDQEPEERQVIMPNLKIVGIQVYLHVL
ncbi:hypothetical protein DM01DRAFT_1174164 [Hesseltinella vesiculosa]|uniref:Uncharacterized protein n=1 Tax=Hesseltinella vesiculosa TaxID=101127 RepID=A0A1X2G680_9FUNG|nr:hypothetical protein DM01DRAFT_1174164 [Hesseltinella vesiculosa]